MNSSLATSSFKRLVNSSSSKTIVDYTDHLSTNMFTQIMNKLKTNTCLNQTEGLFLDFQRSTFENQALDTYDNFVEAIEKKQKLELMKMCSYPMHEIVLAHMKDSKCPLGFVLHKHPVSAKIKQARIFSLDTHNMNSAVTWHQLVIEFGFKNKDGSKFYKHNVFERREDETETRQWRITHIE